MTSCCPVLSGAVLLLYRTVPMRLVRPFTVDLDRVWQLLWCTVPYRADDPSRGGCQWSGAAVRSKGKEVD